MYVQYVQKSEKLFFRIPIFVVEQVDVVVILIGIHVTEYDIVIATRSFL